MNTGIRSIIFLSWFDKDMACVEKGQAPWDKKLLVVS